MSVGTIGGHMIKVKYLLNGSWVKRVRTQVVEKLIQAGLPTCRSRNECCWEAMVTGACQ